MNEMPHVIQIQTCTAIDDKLLREIEDARISPQRTGAQLGQLLIEAGGHVVANLAQRLLDQVEVIQYPLGRNRKRLLPLPTAEVLRRALEKRLLLLQTGQ